MRTSITVTAAVAAMLSLALPARADDDTRRADELFKQARKLMDRNEFAEACPLLEESQKLDPSLGTQLNIALCFKGLGRVATAAVLYREFEAAARAAGDERAAVARKELLALEPRIPHLLIRVDLPLEELAVTIDGQYLPKDQIGVPLPRDPGRVTVHADAAGYGGFTEVVTLREGVTTVVDIRFKPLSEAAVETPAAPPASGARRGRGRRILALVIGGAGVALVGVGTTFGLIARSRWSDAQDHCDGRFCDAEGQDSADGARSAATVSTVTFVAGGALLAAGVILYLTAPSAREPRVAVSARGLSYRF